MDKMCLYIPSLCIDKKFQNIAARDPLIGIVYVLQMYLQLFNGQICITHCTTVASASSVLKMQ